MKKNSNFRGIYAITPPERPFDFILERTSYLLQNGVKILQYRDKSKDSKKRYEEALQLKMLCKQYDSFLIINDDVQLAWEVDADGVHLGDQDEKLINARNILGQEKRIGLSCYNAWQKAEAGIKAGADYVAFGSLFSSQTKPNAVRAALSLFQEIKMRYPHIPTVGIGGIDFSNYIEVLDAGADAVAMISALYSSIPPVPQRLNHFLNR